MVSYIIYLKDGTRIVCDINQLWSQFMSLNKSAICSLHKLYRYEKDMNISLYAYEFPDVDCVGYYASLPSFYGPHAIQDIDVQLAEYLRSLPRSESGHVL